MKLPDKVSAFYTRLRELPDGRWLGVHRLLFHWTVHVDIDPILGCHSDRWCFATEQQAVEAMLEWNGEGDMPGDWHKHPRTGRRRDPSTGEIWKETRVHNKEAS